MLVWFIWISCDWGLPRCFSSSEFFLGGNKPPWLATLNIEIFFHSHTYIEVHTLSLDIPPPIYRFQEDTILGKAYGTKWGASGNMHLEPIGNSMGTGWEFDGLTLNTWGTTKTQKIWYPPQPPMPTGKKTLDLFDECCGFSLAEQNFYSPKMFIAYFGLGQGQGYE